MEKPGSGPPAGGTRERAGSTNLVSMDPYDAHSAELMDVLAMLYFIVEVFRTDETFGDELMAMDPPLPLMLVGMVAGLKDKKVPKGYPVKKVLLLLWKTLLACLGGMTEAAKAKALSRELEGLGPEKKGKLRDLRFSVADIRLHPRVTHGCCHLAARYLDQVPNLCPSSFCSPGCADVHRGSSREHQAASEPAKLPLNGDPGKLVIGAL